MAYWSKFKTNQYIMNIMNAKFYTAPDLEYLIFTTEQGFAATLDGGTTNEEFEEGNGGEPIW